MPIHPSTEGHRRCQWVPAGAASVSFEEAGRRSRQIPIWHPGHGLEGNRASCALAGVRNAFLSRG